MRAALALWIVPVWLLLAPVHAATSKIVAQGAADGSVPAWTVTARAPDGWTADCCHYARAIGVNEVVYRGEWTGEPSRVMVLNVWPSSLPSLQAELSADRQQFQQRDPAATISHFALRHPGMRCAANVFEGSDKLDDIVVFCDPGKQAGVRLSWSMALADADPQSRALLAQLMGVVMSSRYTGTAAQPPGSAK